MRGLVVHGVPRASFGHGFDVIAAAVREVPESFPQHTVACVAPQYARRSEHPIGAGAMLLGATT
jgi:hypothetical protein